MTDQNKVSPKSDEQEGKVTFVKWTAQIAKTLYSEVLNRANAMSKDRALPFWYTAAVLGFILGFDLVVQFGKLVFDLVASWLNQVWFIPVGVLIILVVALIYGYPDLSKKWTAWINKRGAPKVDKDIQRQNASPN